MIALTEAQKSLLPVSVAHRLATLWTIERTDNQILRFTDHNRTLTYEGNAYAPAGGFNSTAREKQSGLKSRNLEVVGVLDSSAITHEDLRGGRYRDARISEYTVDWKYPWVGPFHSSVYWVLKTIFSGERWEAEMAGASRWLRNHIGIVLGRNCRHVLGSAFGEAGVVGCKVDLASITETGTVTGVTVPRKYFSCSGLYHGADRDPSNIDANAREDQWYRYGNVTWLTGANAGLSLEVQASFFDPSYFPGNGDLSLIFSMPFDIAIGDTFTVYPGCDKTEAHCQRKFKNPDDADDPRGNFDNYGGYLYIPGTDLLLRNP